MSVKKIVGLVALVIGLVLLGYGIYGTHRMSEARGDIESKTRYVPGEAVRGAVRGEFYAEVDKYKTPVALCYIGAALFIIGGGVILFYKGKKK